MIKLLIDGVFFQINNTGIARVWKTLIQNLATSENFDIFFLDRGNSPCIEGIHYINFPKYNFYQPEIDSLKIQSICDTHEIDIFSSTYYTTPTKTPMLLIIHDMIPETFKFDMTNNTWIEKGNAISYAHKYIAVSENTKKDLLKYYPEIPYERIDVCHCGVDKDTFFPHNPQEVNYFTKKYHLKKNYFILVGNRGNITNYKNCHIFFKSISTIKNFNTDILCIGGDKKLENYITENLPTESNCIRLDIDDKELSIAYSGAIALIYPSLYEGFGLPILEAMATGCPVITTHGGSLVEVASDSAYIINGICLKEMQKAIINIQNQKLRALLRIKGLNNVKRFCWNTFSNCVNSNLVSLYKESKSGKFSNFLNLWTEARIKNIIH